MKHEAKLKLCKIKSLKIVIHNKSFKSTKQTNPPLTCCTWFQCVLCLTTCQIILLGRGLRSVLMSNRFLPECKVMRFYYDSDYIRHISWIAWIWLSALWNHSSSDFLSDVLFQILLNPTSEVSKQNAFIFFITSPVLCQSLAQRCYSSLPNYVLWCCKL